MQSSPGCRNTPPPPTPTPKKVDTTCRLHIRGKYVTGQMILQSAILLSKGEEHLEMVCSWCDHSPLISVKQVN